MGCLFSKEELLQPGSGNDAESAKKRSQVHVAAVEGQYGNVNIDVDGDGVPDGNGVFVLQRNLGGKAVREGPFLPFIRFDVSAVPKQLFTGDQVYISHMAEGRFFAAGGSSISATADSPQRGSIFVFERAGMNPGTPVTDGDWVLLRDFASGNYLTCVDDFSNLTMEPMRQRGSGNEMQAFQLSKETRPMVPNDGDAFFLQSWLGTFVEVDTGASQKSLRATRWQRGMAQRLSFRKKAAMDSKTTDIARLMQFQSFDLDGNSLATRGEIGFMLNQVGLLDQLDSVLRMVGEKGATKESFKSWADSGAISEEKLQHIEVLGNIAQRFHDCLKDEDALIEILTTIPSQLVQETCAAFQKLTGQDMKALVIQKTTAQDGYIFSNWWRQAMTQLLVDPVELWCQALQDAMDGIGTDENTLTALVCTIPEEYHADIHARYKERKGKSLLEHIESETSFSYKKVLLTQANTLTNARCMALHRAMKGLGTDEQQLIRIVTACEFAERKELASAYEQAYGRSLIEFIESEVSGDFKKALHAIFTAEMAPYDLEADCEALKNAMEGWGTDEAALIKLLCSKTHKQMEDVRARFEEKYGKNLEKWVKSETSGYFQGVLMGLIRDPIKQLAHAVRDCIQGFGTDDTGLITLLSHLPEYKRIALRLTYKQLFNRDLLSDIKGDTSGDYKQALLACVRLPPVVWAEALMGAMKGFGTSDGLLINFLCLSKDYMDEVRAAFNKLYNKPLSKWISSECGNADYKKTLVALSQRDSESKIEMLPIYWAQRCKDALDDVNTLKDIVANVPGLVLKRASVAYGQIYGEDIVQTLTKKCSEGRGFSFFTNWWKVCMLRLIDLPLQLRVNTLHDAMEGLGTDEYTLTAAIMTIPENLHQDVQDLYFRTHNKKLVDRVESETSFNYKKVLKFATLSKIESRCVALNGAMRGLGTNELQLIRIICCSQFKERELICQQYEKMFKLNLIAHIESETSGHFKNALVAILESNNYSPTPDYAADVQALKEAMDGIGTDEDAIIRVVASKTDEQLETLSAQFESITGANLFKRIDSETWDMGLGMFVGRNFRETMLTLMRPRMKRLAHCVHYCMEGWGTDNIGLITCLVHLSEVDREDLKSTYRREFNKDVLDHIRSDTSGDYQEALLACVRSQPETYVRALRSSMKGLGTADNLLINWMCLCKDRIDEVRDQFGVAFPGEGLASWISGDCSGDYKDTLLRVANRECLKFPGVEAGCTSPCPPTAAEAVKRFNKTFNELCRQKKKNPNAQLVIPEEAQQELGCAFLFWSAPGKSSCAPSMDMAMLWEMTNAISSAENRFCPQDADADLRATFREWDLDGSGSIEWNEFVQEMNTRVNDPNHYNAKPLKED